MIAVGAPTRIVDSHPLARHRVKRACRATLIATQFLWLPAKAAVVSAPHPEATRRDRPGVKQPHPPQLSSHPFMGRLQLIDDSGARLEHKEYAIYAAQVDKGPLADSTGNYESPEPLTPMGDRPGHLTLYKLYFTRLASLRWEFVLMLHGDLNDKLIQRLKLVEAGEGSSFWSCKRATARKGAHALLHYPAMMVPTLQGKILECVKETDPHATTVFDPFVGSGTVLVETMTQGLDFLGVDINPLAGLACLAKSGPYFVSALNEKVENLRASICMDNRSHTPRDFNGRDKWFSNETASDLEKLAYHIRREPSLWARRLFWLALARVVRDTCRSRKSTYKLHIDPGHSSKKRKSALCMYVEVLTRFEEHVQEQYEEFDQRGVLVNGWYTGDVNIKVTDSSKPRTRKNSTRRFDIVMTSPPYGDNTTTIPYGQYSYLPLKWIDLFDISEEIDAALTASTHATDTASLGGTKRDAANKLESLLDNYSEAQKFAEKIKTNMDAKKRFAAFFYDLELAVDSIAERTSPSGVHAWTVANRRIGGIEAPMVPLLKQMLEKRSVYKIGEINRGIHFKKMASRNSISATMTSETILIARKRG